MLPVDTLLAVAEEAHAQCGAPGIVALLDARMGEVYFAGYAREGGHWRTVQPPALGRPEDVLVPPGWTIAGNAHMLHPGPLARRLLHDPALLQPARAVAAGPCAAGGIRSAPPATARPCRSLGIRDEVMAQTTAERAARPGAQEITSRHLAGDPMSAVFKTIEA